MMTHPTSWEALARLKASRRWAIFAISAAVLVSACAPRAAKHNQTGNTYYANGAYADAIEAYRLAQIADSRRPEPHYNAANAYNRNAQLSATLAQTVQALKNADAELAARAWYNLGNAYYDAEKWSEAIAAYKAALRIDPADVDAKHNLELALQEELDRARNQLAPTLQEEVAPDESDVASTDEASRADSDPTPQPHPESSQESQEGSDTPTQQTVDRPPTQTPSPHQARQLLEALVGNGETLQQRLQKTFRVHERPPDRDW